MAELVITAAVIVGLGSLFADTKSPTRRTSTPTTTHGQENIRPTRTRR